MQVVFMDAEHRHRFHEALVQVQGNAIIQGPSDFISALYLISGNPDLCGKAVKYFGGLHYFDWPAMMEDEDLSSGIQVLARLSATLFNGGGNLRTADLWRSLDDKNFELALRAIRLRRWAILMDACSLPE